RPFGFEGPTYDPLASNGMRTATALVLLGLVASHVAAQESTPAREWVLDTDELFPENVPRDANGLPRYVIKQVVDADTGRPIAGATVDLIYGVAERSGISRRASVSKRSTVSGEDGWARVRIDDIRDDHVFFMVQVDAPGY